MTCRVASLLIAGENRREYVSAPYTFVRDVLYRYVPQVNWETFCFALYDPYTHIFNHTAREHH